MDKKFYSPYIEDQAQIDALEEFAPQDQEETEIIQSQEKAVLDR